MRNIVATNLHQQRIPLCCFVSLYETVQGRWLKSNSGDFEDYLPQGSKAHGLLRSNASIALPYQLIDVTPRGHIHGLVIGYSLSDCGILFFIGPSLGLIFFLILSVLGKQIIHHRLPAYSILVADDFEGSRFRVGCDEFII